MKKIFLLLTTLFLISFLMVGIAQAVSVEVTAIPEKITPNETTLITVTCNEDASGSITVFTPSGASYVEQISISAGVPLSVNYPGDFQDASSSEHGPYPVIVYLGGTEKPFTTLFTVSFEVHVIPVIPLVGTAGATVAMLSGLGLFIIKRRKRE